MQCTSNPDLSELLFIEAYNNFLASIPEPDGAKFSKCASQENFLADIKQLEVVAKQKRRGGKFLKQISKLSDGLAQYFKVIEIVISSHPQYTAIAWGVFRLVLQVSAP
jgi:hypothetical protein